MNSLFRMLLGSAILLMIGGCTHDKSSRSLITLFPNDGLPIGWAVTDWSDLRKPAPSGAAWKIEGGILRGSTPRGTWLISTQQYGDFVLEFEWKLGERGNSGVALRSPMFGDSAFDGLELQMVDPRYFPTNQTPKP